MKWKGRRQSQNVDDRRGQAGRGGFGRGQFPRAPRMRIPRRVPRGSAGRAGGSSIILIILVGLGLWLFAGVNPLQLIAMLTSQGGGGPIISSPATPERTPQQTALDEERSEFMAVVLAETEDTWGRIFQANGSTYAPPTLVLYSGATQSGCGLGQATTGPFYCPLDRSVYIDMSFFDMLDDHLGAPGDFAQAFVLAHEVGHHVQQLTGVLGRFNEYRRQASERDANAMSVRVELQADCYAGVWAHSVDDRGIVEAGDIDEAIGAAAAVGDDILQRRQQGYVVPESFNHGTAEQRSGWFRRGYESGNPADCDTFGATRI